MRAFFTTILCLTCALTSNAQRYPFYNLSVENGLIQSQVRALSQDVHGHLWIGTHGGLSRYDGKDFTNYSVRNGMLDNSVQALATDKQGNVWLGTQDGISVYNGKKFQHFSLEATDGQTPETIKQIHVASDNTLWCHTDSGVYSIRNHNIKKLALPDSNIIVSTLFTTGDTLWVGTNKGRIYRNTGKTWDSLFYYVPTYDKPPIYTTAFFRDNNNKIWVGSGSGLFYVKNDSIVIADTKDQHLYNIPVISITEDKDDNIWFGSIQGAYCLKKDSTLARFNKQNGFTDNTVRSVLTDKEGSIWFGTDGQGIYRFSGAQFSLIDEKSSLKSEQVMSFASTPKGNLYIGTADAGVYYYDNNTITTVPLKSDNAYISSLLSTGEYDIWIGTNRQGLWRIKGRDKIYYNTADMPGNALVLSLYKDSESRVWIGTNQGAVYYINNKFYKANERDKVVSAFAEIGKDSILMATDVGLILFHDSTTNAYTTNAEPDIANVQCMIEQDKKLWLGTSDNGLLCYDLTTKQSFILNKGNGLQSDFIYNIVADNNGDIWTGTGFGIHKIHLEDGHPIVTFYGKEQGITGMESNQNAATKAPDGTLWFGTTKGAIHIDPEKKMVMPEPISVILQSVKVFGDDIRDSTYYDSLDNWYNVPYKLTLPPKKNEITFSFKGISLSGNGQLVYRYRIDGLEAPWSDWTSLNSVTYSAMQPGKYTLRVECKTYNSSNIKSLSYPFEIITPIHKTWWFSMLILAACILCGVSIQYVLNRRKQNRLALVEKLRREEQGKVRQRTAEDFHDEVGNRLTRINVLTNVLTAKMGNVSPDKQRIIEQIQENTSQLYSGTRDILWSLQSTNDNLYEILHRIRDFGNELFSDTDIKFEFTGTDDRWNNYRLPLDMSRNLLMIFKEALNNCLKYAQPTTVKLHAVLKQDNVLNISLSDDGKGFNVEEVVKGNGLNNMRNRAKRLDGKLYIDSHPGQGTTINLHFRLANKND